MELSRETSQPEHTWLGRALGFLWLAYYAGSFFIAVGWSGGRHDPGQNVRGVTAGIGLVIGTIVGLSQIPNRRLALADDDDLVAYSLAFLGVGGMLPLTHTFSGHRILAIVVFGVTFVLLLLLVIWHLLGQRKRHQRDVDVDGIGSAPRDEAASSGTAIAAPGPS